MAAAALALWPVAGAAAADVLERITEQGTIRLGVRAGAPPFSYDGPDGAPKGLAVTLCRAVVARMAARLDRPLAIEYVRVSATERFPALIEGRTDLHCGPASATLSRRETLDFSLLYFVDGAAAAVRPGGYEAVFTARQGRFGYLAGTTTEAVVRDLIAVNGIEADLAAFASHAAGLRALADGRLDMYVGDQAILLFQLERLGLTDAIEVTEEILSFEPYALVMNYGEGRLRLEVDRALSAIYDSAEIYRMIRDELGHYDVPAEARAVYQIVGLPE